MFVLSAEKMQETDAHAIDKIGIPSIVLMENACRKSSTIIEEAFPKTHYNNALIIAGKGHNGGDGIGIARILAERGYSVELLILGTVDKLRGEPAINYNIYNNLEYRFSEITDSAEFKSTLIKYPKNKTFIVDAIFGTGLNKPIKDGFYQEIIKLINNSEMSVVSIDVPSGLSGKFIPKSDSVVFADLTIAIHSLKEAHLYPDGNTYCGKTVVADIGIPRKSLTSSLPNIKMIGKKELFFLKENRKIDSHKGNYGHCLNIAGSFEKPGAAILSSMAILKSGAGLCTTAVQPENRDIIINGLPELMTKIYNNPEDLIESVKQANIILFGPGVGTDNKEKRLLQTIVKNADCPLIIDADGISLLAENKDFLKTFSKKNEIILTPHPGEFSKLTGLSKNKIRENRLLLASDFAMKYNTIIVLKGHHTVIASPTGNLYINQTGNPGMATAGSGDVLSGIIAGLLSQYYSTIETDLIVATAVFLHGYAGNMARDKKGEISMTASDILKYISKAIRKIDDYKSEFKIY